MAHAKIEGERQHTTRERWGGGGGGGVDTTFGISQPLANRSVDYDPFIKSQAANPDEVFGSGFPFSA